MLRCLIISMGFFLCIQSLSGQCPDRDFLWNRIVYLRDSSHVSSADQLRELNIFLKNISNCRYQNDSTHALLLARIGWLSSQENDFNSAIFFTNQSIDLIHKYAKERNMNESLLIKCYNNLRILYDSTGQKTLRERAIDSCISIAMRLKTGYLIAYRPVNLKIIKYFSEGDYFNCINYTRIGEYIAEKIGSLKDDAFYFLSWKINSLIYLKKYEEASEILNLAISDCIKSGSKNYLGSLLGLKARIAVEEGQVKESIEYTLQSVAYYKAYSQSAACAAALANLGFNLYFTKLHNYDKALKYFNQSLKYASNDYSIEILDNIATTYAQKGDFRQSFGYFKQSFDKIYSGADEKNILNKSGEEILNLVSAETIVNLFLDKAETFLKKYKQQNDAGDLQSALSIYKHADHLMDKIKLVQTEFASKLFWRTDTRRLYEHAIESCYLSGNMEDAFYFFEKSRAVLLNDQLKEQETGNVNLKEMALAKKKIIDLEKKGSSLDPDSKEYSFIQNELFTSREQLKRFDLLVREQNPWYYQSLVDTNFISLQEAQKKLLGPTGAQAILEFFNGDSAVYSLTITQSKSVIGKINKDDFDNNVDRFNSYLSNSSLENRDYPGFIRQGQQLYNIIFKEFPLPKGRVIISPDGKYFPLEALITNAHNVHPDYFLNDHIVSYTYSARFLMNDFSKKTIPAKGNFLGLAPTQYPVSFSLASLPYSDASLGNISSLFAKSHTLVRDQASRGNFLQQFPAYRIIQLYTHSSDSSKNNEPVIYFADSALYLSDLIPENKTAAQLIVLSACETGNGKDYKGEGVFSFNRGFASLGIPSSVINLWSVDNESTYKLTELFYKYVSRGLDLDLALQKAKLEFIATSSKEKRLPYFWAAAILAGKTDPIEIEGPTLLTKMIITGVMMIILLLVLIFNKYKLRGQQPGYILGTTGL